MFRLAHLSDIHITAANLEWTRADWFNKRLAAWVNHRCLFRGFRFRHADAVLTCLMADLRRRRPDHVIFSGDATALGFDAELRRAAALLGLEDFPGLAVPGNHDYCTPTAAHSGLFERHFAPWQEGQRLDGQTYPFAQRAGPCWLVAVNSATANCWAWDASGAVGTPQRERLARLLHELPTGPRILVTHYPVALANGHPERRSHGLRALEPLLRLAAQGQVRLWLHGHRHHPYLLPPTEQVPFPVICAGSATQSGCWSYNEYTLKDYSLEGLRRVFHPPSQSFHDAGVFTLPWTGKTST